VHTVAAKESLYSISKLYGITVQQLKDWNGIEGNEVKIGQTLFIAQPMYGNKTEVKTEQYKVTEVKEPVDTKKQEVVKPIDDPRETTITISEKVVGSDEVKEGGLAELIEGSEGNRKYLALHRTAKVGTILKVRNELNNREVFVRVAGPLPNTGVNTNVVIKISKSAYDRLGAIDQRFRVEVTYYK
jgi:LysM repeat protein